MRLLVDGEGSQNRTGICTVYPGHLLGNPDPQVMCQKSHILSQLFVCVCGLVSSGKRPEMLNAPFYNAQDSSHHKELSSPSVNSAEVEKLHNPV